MPRYRYEAMDAVGSERSDVIEADSEQMAMDEIRKNGLFVTKIGVDKSESGRTIDLDDPLKRFSAPQLCVEVVCRFFYSAYTLLPKRKCSCCTGQCK